MLRVVIHPQRVETRLLQVGLPRLRPRVVIRPLPQPQLAEMVTAVLVVMEAPAAMVEQVAMVILSRPVMVESPATVDRTEMGTVTETIRNP